MGCTPFFFWWCDEVDVGRIHGKVGRLFIGAFRLWLVLYKSLTHHYEHSRFTHPTVGQRIWKKAVSDVVDIVYNVIFGGVSTAVPCKIRNVLPPLQWLARVIFKLRVSVAYRIALAVGEEVHGVAIPLQHICQHTAPCILLCNCIMELKP